MERKKNRKDRSDGYYVAEPDPMHAIMPYLLPDRCNNEAVMAETLDMTEVTRYIEEKNRDDPEFRYTMFHFLCAAIAKTITLRPKLNRFYSGHRLYERKDLSFSFVVKKKFTDEGEEALAIIKFDRESDISPLEQIYEKVRNIVYSVRTEGKEDSTTNQMRIFLKMPRPILRLVFRFTDWLEYHGKYPASMMVDDPYYTTVFISNLGSIQMNADYHHLANHGTNSIFCIIGEKKPTPFYDAEGNVTMKEALKLSLTIDERIADGLYFANSIKLLKKIINNPELIDLPISTPIDME